MIIKNSSFKFTHNLATMLRAYILFTNNLEPAYTRAKPAILKKLEEYNVHFNYKPLNLTFFFSISKNQ